MRVTRLFVHPRQVILSEGVAEGNITCRGWTNRHVTLTQGQQLFYYTNLFYYFFQSVEKLKLPHFICSHIYNCCFLKINKWLKQVDHRKVKIWNNVKSTSNLRVSTKWQVSAVMKLQKQVFSCGNQNFWSARVELQINESFRWAFCRFRCAQAQYCTEKVCAPFCALNLTLLCAARPAKGKCCQRITLHGMTSEGNITR